MTRILLAALAAILILPGVGVAQTKAALITRAEGGVQIVRAGGATEKAGPMKPLYVGDRLQVPAQGKVAVVVYSDGHRESASGESTLKVTATGLEGGKVERTAASRALAGLRSHAAAGEAYAAATTRPKDPDLPLREVNLATDTSVERGRPVIGLPPAGGGGTPRTVIIRGAQGEVHRELLTSNSRTWVPPMELPAGDYEVRVEEEDGNILARRVFTVAANPEVQALLADPSLASRDTSAEVFMAASQFLADQGLFESALEAAQVAVSKEPSPDLLRWTSGLAERLGRLTEAAAWDSLADRLEGKKKP